MSNSRNLKREAGKGDAPRKGADQKAYAAGWDRIFKKKKKKNSNKIESVTIDSRDLA